MAPAPPFRKRMHMGDLIDVAEKIGMTYQITNLKRNKPCYSVTIGYVIKPDGLGHVFLEQEGSTIQEAMFAAMVDAWGRMDHSVDRFEQGESRYCFKAAKIGMNDFKKMVGDAVDDRERFIDSFTYLTPQIESDIHGKVSFDIEEENVESYVYPPWDELLGYRKWGDLCFLGGMSQGDWEQPVFWIIYYDGSNLRGYVPKEGNIWNYDTREALGNNDEADEKFVRSIGWLKPGQKFDGIDRFSDYDVEAIRRDITSRIKVQ